MRSQEKLESFSPLASTEEKSIHDNISLNKQSLEKGLRNRPNQYVLVDRGILRNPGKAFSDKMSQLDLAKKRDKLKIKIANRPEREELVRKLILQEQSDTRQKKFDKIKEILDDSINNRPGSLELIGKNILQVDRLLASRIQSGDITYPKVCGVDTNYTDSLSSNHSTPLPSISEIDIPNTLNELSDLQSLANLSSTKSNSNRSLQYSYKKTCRVGRYSFHNIEFRPAAQKAREYQQNQLVQFEEIQAQRNPNLKRIHSELATKSHNSDIIINETNCSVSKPSLLHRLNVHELKSECKIRMIPCSNIPKVQLVEKLLPYESEILASHASIDSLNHGCSSSQSNRRSMPVIKSTRDFSPPENNIASNMCNTICNPVPHNHSISNDMFSSENCSKLIHSRSEPLIQNFNNNSQPVSSFIHVAPFFPMSNSIQNSNFNFIKLEDNNCLNHQQSFNQLLTNNSYTNLQFCQPNMTINNEAYALKQNIVFQSNPFDNRNLNGWSNLNKNPLQSQPSDSISQIHLFEDQMELDSDFTSSNSIHFKLENDCSPNILPSNINLPSGQLACENKFNEINNEISRMNIILENIKWISQRDNQQNLNEMIDYFKKTKMNLIELINEMINTINEEIKLNIIDVISAENQKNWLNNLSISVQNNFQSIKIECGEMANDYSKSNVDDIINNNNGIRYLCQNNQLNGLNLELLSNHSNPKQNDQFFLEPLINDEIDHFDLNELKIPETPLTNFGDSPLYNDDLDEFFYDLLNVSENIIS